MTGSSARSGSGAGAAKRSAYFGRNEITRRRRFPFPTLECDKSCTIYGYDHVGISHCFAQHLGGGMSYLADFKAAIERTSHYGMAVPKYELRPDDHWLGLQAQQRIPQLIFNTLGQITPKHLLAQCIAIHYALQEPVSALFGAPAVLTIGWIEFANGTDLYRFDDQFIGERLRTGFEPLSGIQLHVWLTLPTMEIIDLTLCTSVSILQDMPEGIGGLLTKKADDVTGFRYIPMLVGEDFFRKTGAILEF